MQLTDSQNMELTRLKQYFPYRVVWGAIHPQTNEWGASANTTKRQMNAHIEQGWIVFQVSQVRNNIALVIGGNVVAWYWLLTNLGVMSK